MDEVQPTVGPLWLCLEFDDDEDHFLFVAHLPDFFDFIGVSFALWVEHLYDYGMLLEALDTDVLTALEELVDQLDIAINGDVLARVFRLRES